jgi:hypothetical protein
VALVQSGQSQEMLGGFGRRGGSLPGPYQRGGVVTQCSEREEVDFDLLG